MKRLLMVAVVMFIGCAAVPVNKSCPPENSIFMAPSGPAEMPKGFFDKGEGEAWMHTEDFKKLMETQRGYQWVKNEPTTMGARFLDWLCYRLALFITALSKKDERTDNKTEGEASRLRRD